MMQKTDILFRKISAEADDEIFDGLAALDKSCVGVDSWSAQSFREEAEKYTGIIIACYAEERTVGLICGFFAADEADITSVAVDKDFRRNGLGYRLLAEFEKNLPEYISCIFLEVRETNFPAISLYEKCGFEKLSVRKNFYDSPQENAIVMRKFIKGEK